MRPLAFVLCGSALLTLAACGGGGGGSFNPPPNPPPAPAAVTISVSPSTGPTVAAGKTLQFTATVSGSSNTGVSWAVEGISGGSATVGTISTTGLYTAPAWPISPGGSARITAVALADTTKSMSVGVNLAYSEATLQGRYLFSLRAGGMCGPFVMLASLVFNAGGTFDGTAEYHRLPGNCLDESILHGVAVFGTYTIGTDGRGSLTFSAFPGQSTAQTMRIVAGTTQSSTVMFSDSNGAGRGTLEKQDPSAFSTAALTGPFVFSGVTMNSGSATEFSAGRMVLDGKGAIAEGIVDVAGPSAITPDTFSGSYLVNADGSGTLDVVTGSSGSSSARLFAISARKFAFLSSDTGSAELGTAELQMGAFLGSSSNLILSGSYIFETAEFPVGSNPDRFSSVGRLVADGSGAITGGSRKDTRGWDFLVDGGTYSTDTKGHVTANFRIDNSPQVWSIYFIAWDRAVFVSRDPVVYGRGSLTFQSGAPFSIVMNGNFNLSLWGVGEPFGLAVATGVPTSLGGILDQVYDGTLQLGIPLTAGAAGTISTNEGTGTGTILAGTNTMNLTYFIVSPSQVRFVCYDPATGYWAGVADKRY